MRQGSIGNRAALTAVVVAFVVGIIGALAVRPSGGNADRAATGESAVARRIHWRLPVAFQTTLPGLGDNPVYVTEMLRAASGGAVDLQIFEPGEVVPAFSISDAVRDGKVEAGYTWLGYDQGKTPASALLAAVPFGMEPWEYAAWWFEAGGRELGEALYDKRYNLHPIFCGITGPETAGWFRERIDSLDDLQGMKIRFAGIGGKVIERLGASVTMIPGGEIFQALEKGAIDATEFSLPIVDQQLGFHRVAPFNYYPGWHQPSTASHLLVNLEVWESISEADRKLLETACTAGALRNLAKTEAQQGPVIAGFPAIGVQAEDLPQDLLLKLREVTEQVLADEAAKDPDFRAILESQRRFRADYAHWKTRAYLPRDF
jgi:TRAP-type mannitol/chloroaromatic compound transport system substrate-binding protein